MVKTHEVSLTSSLFSNVRDYDYFIIQNNNYETGDYVLFKEVETIEETTKETGMHKMTKIRDVIMSDGLKEGYVLLFLSGLN
ncbi:MAG: hypothetical protein ACLRP9_01855 [Anaerovoracaceae bacterium]